MNRDIDYVVVTGPHEGPFAGERVVLAADRLGHYERELGLRDVEHAQETGRLVERLTGADLLGRRYTPPFDFFAGRENAHQVLEADYVTTDEGTGIVHIAPAFGEEDKVVTDAAGIEPVVPVDGKGEFTAEVPPYAGQHVFEANKAITRDLREAGLLLRLETYEHPYPHCWRCDQPLIYRAVSSWFVKVTAVPRPDARAEPGDHLGARPHPGRLVRQVAGERPRLVDQPQPLLGQPDPGLDVGRPDATRGSTSTARWTSWSATSACARRTCTAPTSTS